METIRTVIQIAFWASILIFTGWMILEGVRREEEATPPPKSALQAFGEALYEINARYEWPAETSYSHFTIMPDGTLWQHFQLVSTPPYDWSQDPDA